MYKIAVIGDYDSIYGFATLGLSICPVKTREDARKKLKQLADGQYGIIYITEAVAAQIEEEIEQYRENTLPAIIQIPGVSGNTGAGVNGVKKTVCKNPLQIHRIIKRLRHIDRRRNSQHKCDTLRNNRRNLQHRSLDRYMNKLNK